ncbi:MAG TPA: hypothetical protein VM286_00525 [Candidatus Thermoplasmatota archaeon]|nr:hypothetical protein [Candidatus Thermoplasmatota archaeon]
MSPDDSRDPRGSRDPRASDNRIRVRVEPEMTPIRLEDRMDLNSEIKVAVDSHLKGLAVAGLVAIALGTLLLLVGCIYFTFGYPDLYRGNAPYTFAEATTFIERVVEALAAGVILLFGGTSAFFYGRLVLGSGHLDQFTTQALEVEQ